MNFALSLPALANISLDKLLVSQTEYGCSDKTPECIKLSKYVFCFLTNSTFNLKEEACAISL